MMTVFFKHVVFIFLFFLSGVISTGWCGDDEYIEDGIPLLARDSYYPKVDIEKFIASEVVMEEEDAKTCFSISKSLACIPPWQNKALACHVLADVFSVAAILSTAASIWYTFNNHNNKDSIYLGKDWNLVSMGTAVMAVLCRLSGDYFDVKKSKNLCASADCSSLYQYLCFSCLAASSSGGGCSNFCRELSHDKYQKTGDFCKMLTYAVYPTSAILSVLAFVSVDDRVDLQFNIASIVLSSMGAFTSKSLYLYKSLHYKKTNDNKISALEEGRRFIVNASKTLASSMLVDRTMHDEQLSLYERRKKSVDILKYYNNIRYNKDMKKIARFIFYGKFNRNEAAQHIKDEMKRLKLRPTEEESLAFQSVVWNQVENLETLEFIDPFVKRVVSENFPEEAQWNGRLDLDTWLSGKVANVERDRFKAKIRSEVGRKRDIRRVTPIVREIISENLPESQWEARINARLVEVNDDNERKKLTRIVKSEISNLRDIELEHIASHIVSKLLDDARAAIYINEKLGELGITEAERNPFIDIVKNKILRDRYKQDIEEIARKTLFRRRLVPATEDNAFIAAKLNGQNYSELTVELRNRLIPLIREKLEFLKMRKVIAPIADRTILNITRGSGEPEDTFNQRRSDYINVQLRTLGLSVDGFADDINVAIEEFERERRAVELAEEVMMSQIDLNDMDAVRQYIGGNLRHPTLQINEVEKQVKASKFKKNAERVAIYVIGKNEDRAYINVNFPNSSELDRLDLITQQYVNATFQNPNYSELDRLDLIEEVKAHAIPNLRHFGFLA